MSVSHLEQNPVLVLVFVLKMRLVSMAEWVLLAAEESFQLEFGAE